MKKTIYGLTVMLFFVSFIHAQKLIWHQDMSVASELAIQEQKPLLLFFTGSDWCGWCIKLQREVLSTKDFETWAAANVILVELDFPRRKKLEKQIQIQNYQLQNLFKVREYPTVVFADPEKTATNKMNLVHRGSTGFVEGGAKKWLAVADKIISTTGKS